MIRLNEKILVGTSDDGHLKDNPEVKAVLNVAHDLRGVKCWPRVEYAQVGLMDGPGNEVSTYCAALMALLSLERRYDRILVYDHSGSRALAVVIMYTALTEGKVAERVDFMRRRSWDEILLDLSSRAGKRLAEPNPEHRKAFYDLPYGILEALL